MKSQEIRDLYTNCLARLDDPNDPAIYIQTIQAAMLTEIAVQLAVMNERRQKDDDDKLSSRHVAGHKEKTASVRKSSQTMYFRPAHWGVELPLDDLRQFNPNSDQPELQELEIGQVSIGTLGTKPDAEVKRTR